jgi:predicted alpha/beta-hydrolase family hydrolase
MARPGQRSHPIGSGCRVRSTLRELWARPSRLRALSRALAVYPVAMAIRFYVGHGASGSAASMAAHVRGLIARGIDARAIDLPLKKAEAAVPALRAIVPDGPAAPGADGHAIAVGGQSYGGRVASLAAAEPDTDYAALVLFSYPLHPPGSPDRTADRIAHWPAIRCPVLLLSGEADPFARIELLRAAVPLLANAELVTYPRLGHTLKPVLEDALDRTARFLEDAAG